MRLKDIVRREMDGKLLRDGSTNATKVEGTASANGPVHEDVRVHGVKTASKDSDISAAQMEQRGADTGLNHASQVHPNVSRYTPS